MPLKQLSSKQLSMVPGWGSLSSGFISSKEAFMLILKSPLVLFILPALGLLEVIVLRAFVGY